MADKQVSQAEPQSKTKLSSAISAVCCRVANNIWRGTFADKAAFDEVTIKRAMAGLSLPAAENLLNSLAADPSSLDEVLALYGLHVRPALSVSGCDMQLAALLGRCAAELIERISDGIRCHNDTLALAEVFRAVIPKLQSVVDEADRIRVGED